MEWSNYIENLISMGNGKIKNVAIISREGERLASSEGFEVNEQERQEVANAWNDIKQLPSRGLTYAGTHYIIPRTEDRLFYGKKDSGGLFRLCEQKI